MHSCARDICKHYERLHTRRNLSERDSDNYLNFAYGKIEYKFSGSGTLAIRPAEQLDSIVKFNKTEAFYKKLRPRYEYAWLQRAQKLPAALYVTPEPYAYGLKPAFLHMAYLGPTFLQQETFTEHDVIRAGFAVGEFAAHLYQRYGAVHTDLHRRNLTFAPDGKVGILDMEAIVPSRCPEEMFLEPLSDDLLAMAPYMAQKFEEITKHEIQLEKVRAVIESAKNLDDYGRQDRFTNLFFWELQRMRVPGVCRPFTQKTSSLFNFPAP